MGWTTEKTFNPGDVLSASDLNTYLRDDSNYLFSGRSPQYKVFAPSGDYSTTSTSFVDVDATNLIVTVTVNSSRLMCWCSFSGAADNTANSTAIFDLILDSATRAGAASNDPTKGLARLPQNSISPLTIIGEWTGLSVGSHTVKLQYKNLTAAASALVKGAMAAGIQFGSPITFFALEF